MQKIILFSILIISSFILFGSNNASATSGACSSHLGVNCSAGPTIDRKVMCNDGWTNSSVYFSDADECKASSCVAPSGSECRTESDYSSLQSRLLYQGGYLGGSTSGQGSLTNCRNEINQYQSAPQSYNSCLANSSSNNYSPSSYSSSDIDSYVNAKMQIYCTDKYGSNSNYLPSDKTCKCNDGYVFDKNNQCSPKDTVHQASCTADLGPDARYNSSTNTCQCINGYGINKNSQCVPVVNVCIEMYGTNIHAEGIKCICDSGYSYNESSKTCKLQEIIVAPPVIPNIVIPPVIKKEPTIQASKPTVVPKVEIPQKSKEITSPKINQNIDTIRMTPKVEQPAQPKKSVIKRVWGWFSELFRY